MDNVISEENGTTSTVLRMGKLAYISVVSQNNYEIPTNSFFPAAYQNWSKHNDVLKAVKFESAWSTSIPDPSSAFTWWDWTVFLLQTAAEVEHSLLVQYLYSSYSLEDPVFRGSRIPDVVKPWRENLLMIAKQEMAHLATVQNLLRFIGGPLNFEREDFPFRNFLYPFKLALEPLSKKSLTKYVCAEMPQEHDEPDSINNIMQILKDEDGPPTNRVGELYEKLISIFNDSNKLPDNYFRSDVADKLQARPEDWTFNDPCLLVRKISSRQEAIKALEIIAEQGEGLGKPHNDQPCPLSHFEIFLQMFKEFSTIENETNNGEWPTVVRVPINPNTLLERSSETDIENSRITNHLSLLFAHLFNIHYRKLLMYLSHSFTIEDPKVGDSSVKKSIIDLTFNQMWSLSEIARRLVELPLKAKNAENDAAPKKVAASPFELPPSLTFPDRMGDQ